MENNTLLPAIGFTVAGVGSFIGYVKSGWTAFLLASIVFSILGIYFIIVAWNE